MHLVISISPSPAQESSLNSHDSTITPDTQHADRTSLMINVYSIINEDELPNDRQ